MFHLTNDELLREVLRKLERIEHLESHILHQLYQRFIVRHFIIEKENPLTPVSPGFNPVYTASPIPAGAILNPSQPAPTWTTSDPTNAPVTADASGLNAAVAIPASAPVGTAFTLTVSYTNLDGTVAQGALDQTIASAPPVDVTGFTIAQSA